MTTKYESFVELSSAYAHETDDKSENKALVYALLALAQAVKDSGKNY